MADGSQPPPPPLTDPDDALRRAGGRPEVARELFRVLRGSLDDSAIRLRQALEARDPARLHDAAHRLHGACLYCGVPRLRDAAGQLERICGARNHDCVIDDLGAAVERLLEVIEATSRAVDPVAGDGGS